MKGTLVVKGKSQIVVRLRRRQSAPREQVGVVGKEAVDAQRVEVVLHLGGDRREASACSPTGRCRASPSVRRRAPTARTPGSSRRWPSPARGPAPRPSTGRPRAASQPSPRSDQQDDRARRPSSAPACERSASPNVCRITGDLRIGAGPRSWCLSSAAGDELLEAHVAALVDLRRLQLGEQACLALDQRHRLVEGRHALVGELAVEPRAGVEALDLLESEVVGEPRAALLAFESSSVNRDGNSSSTLVVRSRLGSCRQMRTPSRVTARSCSTKSAPCSRASR